MVWGTTWQCPLQPQHRQSLNSKFPGISPALCSHLAGAACAPQLPQGHPEPGEAPSPAWTLAMLPSTTGRGSQGCSHPQLASLHPQLALLHPHPTRDDLLWQEIRCSALLRISYVHKKLMYKWVKKMQSQESSEMEEEEESSFGNGRTSSPCSGKSQLGTQGSSGRAGRSTGTYFQWKEE